jgi:hypothetical protein
VSARFVVPSVALLLASVAAPALAQSGRPTFEVAGQATFLKLNDSDSTNTGIGGRFLWDFSRWVSADMELSYFPKDTFEQILQSSTLESARVTYERRRTHVLAGVKAGYRGDRFGVFGKVRPGFTHLTDEGMDCSGALCALALFVRPEYRTEFALDLGGMVEFYPSRRLVARLDLGDEMIRHRSTAVPPCVNGDCTSHNFTSRLGVGLKF